MIVLAALMGVTSVSSLLAWNWQPGLGGVIVLCLLSLVFAFWAGSVRKKNDLSALLPGLLLGITEGALLGPVFHMYVKRLGPQTVLFALDISVGIMVVCAAVSYLFQIRTRPLESIAFIGLLGLILYGVITLFIGLPPVAIDNTYCVIGIIIFVAFFIVDFTRLKEASANGEDDWGTAALLGVSIYLDFLNVLLYVLRLFGNSKSDD